MIPTILSRLKIRRDPRRKAPDTLSIANAFVTETMRTGVMMNAVRLQSMMILADAWSLHLMGRPIHSSRPIAICRTLFLSDVHKAFRRWGTDPIGALALHPMVPAFDHPADDDPERLQIIKKVLSACHDMDNHDLRLMISRNLPDIADYETVTDEIISNIIRDNP